MKHRRKLVIGLGAAVFSLGLIATGGTAQAGTDGVDYVYTSGSPSGKVWFKSDGDVWTIYDWAKDGHGVGVWFRVNEGPAQLLVNNNGYNTSVKYDKDYVEGSKIRFMACLTEQGGVWDCDGTWSSAVFPGTSATA